MKGWIEASECGVHRLHDDDDGGGGGGVHRGDDEAVRGLWLLPIFQYHQIEAEHVTADQNHL